MGREAVGAAGGGAVTKASRLGRAAMAWGQGWVASLGGGRVVLLVWMVLMVLMVWTGTRRQRLGKAGWTGKGNQCLWSCRVGVLAVPGQRVGQR